VLIAELVNKGMTYEQIGETFGVSRQRIHQLFKRPLYFLNKKSGIDFLADKVRKRDNNSCVICGKIWRKGRKFDVHHIDKEKESLINYNNYKDFSRMVTLCHRCHMGLTLSKDDKKVRLQNDIINRHLTMF
jgi:hypothetical protein